MRDNEREICSCDMIELASVVNEALGIPGRLLVTFVCLTHAHTLIVVTYTQFRTYLLPSDTQTPVYRGFLMSFHSEPLYFQLKQTQVCLPGYWMWAVVKA